MNSCGQKLATDFTNEKRRKKWIRTEKQMNHSNMKSMNIVMNTIMSIAITIAMTIITNTTIFMIMSILTNMTMNIVTDMCIATSIQKLF